MLRKRSRGVGGNVLVENVQCGALLSPSERKCAVPTSPFFGSPRLFTGFYPKGFSESECVMSPTSVLDSKPFSGFGPSLWFDTKSRRPESANESKNINPCVGLGLVDALDEGEKTKNGFSKSENKMVLFGLKLKIQIPQQTDSPAFGSPVTTPDTSNFRHSDFPGTFSGPLTPREMELSEDYTCVITHGPNPKTTRIFGDRIIESHSFERPPCSNDLPSRERGRINQFSDNFLRFCCACKKELGEKDDIFMYRGEKAFCSGECRHQEMLFDERMEKLASNSFGSPPSVQCDKVFAAVW